jgi:amino acid adenylation domain-containing protein
MQIKPQQSVREYLGGVRRMTLEAYEHQDVPFEKLVEELHPQRDLTRSPLFQVKLVLQQRPSSPVNARPAGSEPSGLRIGGYDFDHLYIKLWLNLMLEESGGQIEGSMKYCADLFDQTTIERLCGQVKLALMGMAEGGERRLGQLELITAGEREQLLSQERPVQEADSQRCVDEMFSHLARLHPDTIAVVCEQESISYGHLDSRSDRLAARLQRSGIGAEMRVAIYLRRGVRQVEAVLGVLKSGAAYVPVEVSQPPGRVLRMLEDSGAALIISGSEESGSLPSYWAETLIIDEGLDHQRQEQQGQATAQQQEQEQQEGSQSLRLEHRRMGGATLAYVIYTSGSTGQPKGVMIEHRQLVSYVEAVSARVGLRAGQRMALVSTMSADLGHTMLYASLIKGGELHIVSQSRSRDAAQWEQYVQERAIQCVKMTPSHVEAIVRSRQAMVSEVMIIGGEQLKKDEAMRLTGSGARVINHYGPTETTVGVLTSEVEADECAEVEAEEGAQWVAIGTELRHVRVKVSGEHGEAKGIGAHGEIWIGGAAVGRGYLGRADQTADKYVPEEGGQGTRAYRSGDRGRRKQGGDIEYLGRIDEQVKVRGYRVEPGEIEEAMREQAGVKQAAVIVRAEEGAGQMLVGYAVMEEGTEVNEREMKRQIGERVPEYMVPVRIVRLERMPLTANGKLDRKALPTPDAETREDLQLPRDSTELELYQIWRSILHLDELSIYDNFFDLGGYSLTAVSLSYRLSELYSAGVTVRTVFDHPTIDALAKYLRQEVALVPPSTAIPIQPNGSRRPFFCAHSANGLAHVYILLSRCLGPDQPFYGLQSHGLDIGQIPLDRVEDMAARYVADLRRIQPAGPYQLGGWSLGALIAYEMGQQLFASGEEVSLLALFDAELRANHVEDRPLTEAELLIEEREYLVKRLFKDFSLLFADSGEATDSELLRRYLDLAKSAGAIPAEVREEQYRQVLRVTVMNKHAVRRYRPKPYPGRITLFRSDKRQGWDADYGWSSYAMGGVDVYLSPGGHTDFVFGENAAIVASQLAGCFSDAANVRLPDCASAGTIEKVGDEISQTLSNQ